MGAGPAEILRCAPRLALLNKLMLFSKLSLIISFFLLLCRVKSQKAKSAGAGFVKTLTKQV